MKHMHFYQMKISVLNTQQNYNDSSKKNFSKEELEKRIRWAKQYAKYKKIKEEKSMRLVITKYKILLWDGLLH